jgi:hypothetical protein
VCLIFITFQAIILSWQNPPIKNSIRLHPCEYLSNDYLAVLEKTKSPLQAFSVGPIKLSDRTHRSFSSKPLLFDFPYLRKRKNRPVLTNVVFTHVAPAAFTYATAHFPLE